MTRKLVKHVFNDKQSFEKFVNKWHKELDQSKKLGNGRESVAYSHSKYRVIIFTTDVYKLEILKAQNLIIKIEEARFENCAEFKLTVKRLFPIRSWDKSSTPYPDKFEHAYDKMEKYRAFIYALQRESMSEFDVFNEIGNNKSFPKHIRRAAVAICSNVELDNYSIDCHEGNWMMDKYGNVFMTDPLTDYSLWRY